MKITDIKEHMRSGEFEVYDFKWDGKEHQYVTDYGYIYIKVNHMVPFFWLHRYLPMPTEGREEHIMKLLKLAILQ